MGWVPQEKQALINTLRNADPEGPTLCAGWDVRRLLAHLVQREQAPLDMIRDTAARRPAGQEPGLTRLVQTTTTPEGYQALIDRFDAGPPRWSPMRWAAEKINSIEYVVHHEDIRRASPAPAEPRDLPAGYQGEIWSQLGLIARLSLRTSPVGVTLVTGLDGPRSRVIKKGDGVSLVGEPVELALHLNGRRDQADVEITGEPEAVRRYREWTTA